MQKSTLLVVLALLAASCTTTTLQPPVGPYTADIPSLEQHNPVPDWMRDAKFGIYVHWGVCSVPA